MFKRILFEHRNVLRIFTHLKLKKVHVEKICVMIAGSDEVS